MPEPKPYSGFRLQVDGASDQTEGYTYYSDGFYDSLPKQLNPPLFFDIQPTLLSDNRTVAVKCIGDFDCVL